MAKHITIIGAVAALILAPAVVSAADLAVKAPAPVAAVYDWTGFYLGVSGGGSLGTSDHIDPISGQSFTGGYNIKGGLVGGTLGYNWQVSSFVVGLEGDVSWVHEFGTILDQGPASAFITQGLLFPPWASSTTEKWMATARGRVGYAVNNLLFYATGGYAAAGADANVRDATTNAVLASMSSTRSGWTAGGGLEWGFAPNWSAKFEIMYMKFNTVLFNTVVALSPTVFEGPRRVPLDDTIARVGINYRFGGPAVVARY
jgi:outer membrane immunogenic protein